MYAQGFIVSLSLILRQLKSNSGVRQRLISPVQGNDSFHSFIHYFPLLPHCHANGIPYTVYPIPHSPQPLNPFEFDFELSLPQYNTVNPVPVPVAGRGCGSGNYCHWVTERVSELAGRRGILSLSGIGYWKLVLVPKEGYFRGRVEGRVVYAEGLIHSIYTHYSRKSNIGVRQRLISPLQGNGSYV